MATLKLTPTQQKFFDLLADGCRHEVKEFIALLPDPLGDQTNVHKHIQSLRTILRPLCEDVVGERVNRVKTYRRVRTIMQGGE
jgi:hypothetical protein